MKLQRNLCLDGRFYSIYGFHNYMPKPNDKLFSCDFKSIYFKIPSLNMRSILSAFNRYLDSMNEVTQLPKSNLKSTGYRDNTSCAPANFKSKIPKSQENNLSNNIPDTSTSSIMSNQEKKMISNSNHSTDCQGNQCTNITPPIDEDELQPEELLRNDSFEESVSKGFDMFVDDFGPENAVEELNKVKKRLGGFLDSILF